jgi:hypothetical protein
MFGTEEWGLVAIGGGAVFLSAVFYMWGGTAGFGKFWRRFVGSFVLTLSTNLLAIFKGVWAWQLLLIWPALIIAFGLPYGSDTFWGKAVKRAVFALGNVSAGFFGYWAMGMPTFGIGILIFQLFIGSGSIYLGVKNPYKNAPLEQFLICILLTLTIPFWAFVK